MATNLYEELDLPEDASPEQVRKAYKKKALKTHPDRLPPNATPEEKAASEEHFRKVNNAYEVLTDPQKRKEYDRYGVWPPPDDEEEEEPLPRRPSGSRPNSYSRHRPTPRTPFGDHFFSHPYHPFAFTDPFTLFNSIFGDFPSQNHNRPSPYRPYRSRSDDPFQMAHRMQQEMGNMLAHFERDMFNTVPNHSFGFVPPMPRLPAAPVSSDGHWAQESFATSTVNGVTQTIHKKRDWDGNEHVTRTYPDGQEVYTINGEQPSSHRAYIEPRPAIPRLLPAGPPPPYPTHNTSYNPSRKFDQGYHRPTPSHQAPVDPRRRSVHKHTYPMNTSTDYQRRGGW